MNSLNPRDELNNKSYIQLSDERSDELGVEIASPWLRMGAYIINLLMPMILLISMAILAPMSVRSKSLEMFLFLGVKWICIFYIIWQLVWMSKYGQSIGKRLLKIRVIKRDGSRAGFVKIVLLREVLFNIVLGLAVKWATTIVSIFIVNDLPRLDMIILSNMVASVVWVVCVIMLFQPKRDRRTLQDLLAGTVVVKLP